MNTKLTQSAGTRRNLHTHTHTHTSSLLLSFLSVILISSPSYSSGITSNANSATCDNSTLETYTGTSNLQANWSANEITVKWYADSEAEQPMTTNTCFYGPNSALTLPPASSMVNLKPGYTFAGWRVRQTPCSFASSVCGLNGSDLDGLTSQGYGYAHLNANAGYNESTYGLTTGSGQWAVSFTNGGIVRGIASCNSTMPTIMETIMTAMGNGTMSEESPAAESVPHYAFPRVCEGRRKGAGGGCRRRRQEVESLRLEAHRSSKGGAGQVLR